MSYVFGTYWRAGLLDKQLIVSIPLPQWMKAMGETIDSSLAKWVLMGQIKEEDDDVGGIWRADRRGPSEQRIWC